jgi:hypothetical protein
MLVLPVILLVALAVILLPQHIRMERRVQKLSAEHPGAMPDMNLPSHAGKLSGRRFGFSILDRTG